MTICRLLWLSSVMLALSVSGRAQFVPATGSPFPVGTAPISVAAGDFNGDGHPDLAVANSGGGTVTVLLGDGNGGFKQAQGSPFPVGQFPHAVAVGDFNRDGNLDLAIANQVGNSVTVLLGNGTGGFTEAPASPFPVGLNPGSLVVGDFNGDGNPDLAVGNVGDLTLTVLSGDGTGGFTAGSPFALLEPPLSLAVGDFNGDGKPDLAIANEIGDGVTVLLGDGTGGFTQAPGSPFPVGGNPASVAVGDFNLDGNLDLAVANSASNTVTVLLGNGTGGFTPAQGSPPLVGTEPSFVAVGDFNSDGIPDLTTANTGADTVTVLLGNGTGGFTPAQGSPFRVGGEPVPVAVEDFNGDGLPDLAVANLTDSTVTVLLNTTPPVNKVTSYQPLPDAVLSEPYSAGIGNYSCSLAGGSLPPGLHVTVVSGFCTISGIATELATYQFIINYIGAVAGYQITVDSSPSPSGFQVTPTVSATSSDTSTAPVPQSITVTNNNTYSASFIASIVGPAVASYSISPTNDQIPASGSMQLTVTFNSNGVLVPPGFYTATYTITNPQSYSLSRTARDRSPGGHALFETKPDVSRPRTSSGGTPSNSGIANTDNMATLTIGPSVLDLTLGSEPSQTFEIDDQSGFTVQVAASYTGAGAVAIANPSGFTPIHMTVTETSAAPPPGPNSGQIWVTCGAGVNCDPQPIQVQLFQPAIQPVVNAGGVLNSASYTTEGVAPGSIVSIYGTNLAASTAGANAIPLLTALGDVSSVTFNNIPAGLYYVGQNQINAQLPFDVVPSGQGGTVKVVVTSSIGTSAPQDVTIVPASPGIFTRNAEGFGQAYAYDNTTGAFAAPGGAPIGNFATAPISVSSGHALIIACTGLGSVTPSIGNYVPASDGTFRNTLLQPTVLIGGVEAQFVYSVLSPQYVSEYQIGVVPGAGTPTGSAVPLQIRIGGVTTTDKVTIAVAP